MSAERIDYFYAAPTKKHVAFLVATGLAMPGPLVAVGILVFSWKLIGTGLALITLLLVWFWFMHKSNRIRAKTPALSIFEKHFAFQCNGKIEFIQYTALKSIDVYEGDGLRNMRIRHFTEGRLHDTAFNAGGIPVRCDSILKLIAQRVPAKNNPRLGPGVLFCTPVSDLRKLYAKSR